MNCILMFKKLLYVIFEVPETWIDISIISKIKYIGLLTEVKKCVMCIVILNISFLNKTKLYSVCNY